MAGIRILNFDDSVTTQQNLCSRYAVETIDLTDIAGRTRFWIHARDQQELNARLPNAPSGAVTFLGSGDFHHVTALLLERYREPIALIDFDLHFDWDRSVALLHCGSWVSHALRRGTTLSKALIFGAPGKIHSPFTLQTGDFSLLANDRLEIYPYAAAPATVFFRHLPANIAYQTTQHLCATRIFWNALKDKNVFEFFLHIIRRLPTRKVYVTVDKDCLGTVDSLTNWDQGVMPLETLLAMLKMIKDNCDIVGMDITGDYSPVRVEGIIKKKLIQLNHPAAVTATRLDPAVVRARNEATNLKILATMLPTAPAMRS